MKPVLPPPPPNEAECPKLRLLMYTCDTCNTCQPVQDPIVTMNDIVLVACYLCDELTRIHEKSLELMPIKLMHHC